MEIEYTIKSEAPWYIKPIFWLIPKDFGITIWNMIYVPNDFSINKYPKLLQHENIHIQQWKKYKILFPILYFFVAPVFFAYFRWKFEREAYLINIKAGASQDKIVELLWHNYWWTWPRPWMKKWFDEHK